MVKLSADNQRLVNRQLMLLIIEQNSLHHTFRNMMSTKMYKHQLPLHSREDITQSKATLVKHLTEILF